MSNKYIVFLIMIGGGLAVELDIDTASSKDDYTTKDTWITFTEEAKSTWRSCANNVCMIDMKYNDNSGFLN